MLFGETFQWNIPVILAHGGLPYFAPAIAAYGGGECINFPIQRNFVFRSKGNLAKQIAWVLFLHRQLHQLAVGGGCGPLVPDFIYNIGTTVLNGGISMVIFFFVNKIIFPEGAQAK